MSEPTPERKRKLRGVVFDGILEGRDLEHYTEWDDLVEVDKALTLEEFHWCQENLWVHTTVEVGFRDDLEGQTCSEADALKNPPEKRSYFPEKWYSAADHKFEPGEYGVCRRCGQEEKDHGKA